MWVYGGGICIEMAKRDRHLNFTKVLQPCTSLEQKRNYPHYPQIIYLSMSSKQNMHVLQKGTKILIVTARNEALNCEKRKSIDYLEGLDALSKRK